jgi:hypothetical protein
MAKKVMLKAPTKFLNSKRRVIYRTAKGKYFAKTEKGAMVYKPKACYVKSPRGTERMVSNSSARVPNAIRPKEKMARKVRSNSGKARGARAGVKAGALMALFSPKPKRAVGRPRKHHLVSPKAAYGLPGMFMSPGMGPVQRRYKGVMARKLKLRRKRAAGKTPMERLMSSLN